MADAFSSSNQLHVSGETSIQDLHSPQQFVATILAEIATAQDTVILSALYLGTGTLEQQIIDAANAALNDPNRPNFKITFLLDHSRGQRGAINSTTVLQSLITRHYPRAQLYLYQMPQLRGVLNFILPPQLKELMGVYHCKFSVFDNKCILSGANLSEEYFVNRQDRYFLIQPDSNSKNGSSRNKNREDCLTNESRNENGELRVDSAFFNAGVDSASHKTATTAPINDISNPCMAGSDDSASSYTLASYLTEFAEIVTKESHSLLPDGSLQAPENTRYHSNNNSSSNNSSSNSGSSNSGSKSGGEESGQGGTNMGSALLNLVRNSHNRIPSTSSNTTNTTTATATLTPNNDNTPSPTRIYPLIQHAHLHVHQESAALHTLLLQPFVTLQKALLCIATPYTNFRSSFLRTLLQPLQHDCSVELAVPSVPTHGFGSAKGAKGYIPALHYYSLQVECEDYINHYHNNTIPTTPTTPTTTTMNNHNNNNHSTSDTQSVYNTYYYMRPQWTYHTKGIWLFPNTMTETQLINHTDAEVGDTTASSPNISNNTSRESMNFPSSTELYRSDSNSSTTSIGIDLDKMYHNAAHSRNYDTYIAAHTTNNNNNHHNQHSNSNSNSNSNSTCTHTKQTHPNALNNMVTYIGSSNFGERSWSRDFELGFVFATSEVPLKQLFLNEYLNMRGHCGVEVSPGMASNSQKSPTNYTAHHHKPTMAAYQHTVGTPVARMVPPTMLPHHTRLQRWLLYSIARVVRSFL